MPSSVMPAISIAFPGICALLAGCAGMDRSVAATDEATGLCEVFYSHEHQPDWNYFNQDVSRPGLRQYTCTTLHVDTGESESAVRARLEPWCREKIADAMRSSSTCSGTRFAITGPDLKLDGRFDDLDDGGRAYVVSGTVDVE